MVHVGVSLGMIFGAAFETVQMVCKIRHLKKRKKREEIIILQPLALHIHLDFSFFCSYARVSKCALCCLLKFHFPIGVHDFADGGDANDSVFGTASERERRAPVLYMA